MVLLAQGLTKAIFGCILKTEQKGADMDDYRKAPISVRSKLSLSRQMKEIEENIHLGEEAFRSGDITKALVYFEKAGHDEGITDIIVGLLLIGDDKTAKEIFYKYKKPKQSKQSKKRRR